LLKQDFIKKILASLVLILLCFASIVENADAAERISGASRYHTAVEISKAGWNESNTVIIAQGEDFPDALAGGPLAYKEGAPILLAKQNSLPTSTEEEIVRLSANKVIILGGYSAVSKDVEKQLKKLVPNVDRIGGNSRYSTAALIAEKVNSGKVFIANGENFPDALAVSPYASKNGIPILLTKKSSLPSSTKKAIANKEAAIIGNSAVVSNDVAEKIPGVKRYGGNDRYRTAKAVIETLPLDTKKAFIASGENFPDALTGSVLAAKNNSPIVLAKKSSIPYASSSLLEHYDSYSVLGGESAIEEIAINDLKDKTDDKEDQVDNRYLPYVVSDINAQPAKSSIYVYDKKQKKHILVQEVNSGIYSDVDVYKDKVYYNSNLDLYSVDISGENNKKLVTGIREFRVENNTIYGISSESDKINSYSSSGEYKETLYNKQEKYLTDLAIKNNSLYTVELNNNLDSQIYQVSLGSKDITKIYEHKDATYFESINSNSELLLFNTNHMSYHHIVSSVIKKSVFPEDVWGYGAKFIDDDWVIGYGGETAIDTDKFTFYKMKKDGSESTKIGELDLISETEGIRILDYDESKVVYASLKDGYVKVKSF
jgi:putative cell wall-binding protein